MTTPEPKLHDAADVGPPLAGDQRLARRKLWRYLDGVMVETEDLLTIEHDVEIVLDGQRLTTVRCLPGDLKPLAIGFLLTEGFLFARDELRFVAVDDQRHVVEVASHIPRRRVEAAMAAMRTVTACGGGVTVAGHDDALDCKRPYNMVYAIGADTLLGLFTRFTRTSELYRTVGGVHSAALSDGENILYFSDDIGRHNAIDRVIGAAFLDGRNPAWLTLLTTGRLNLETASKAARLRIPLVASRSAATSDAIALAERFHVALCGRVRQERMAVYCAPWRLLNGHHLPPEPWTPSDAPWTPRDA